MSDAPSSDAPGVKIFPPGVYLAGLLGGYVIEWIVPFSIVPAFLSIPIRLFGLVALVAGGWFMFTATTLFSKLGTSVSPFEASTALATNGPYQYSRNPIYVGMALILAGFALIGNALWPLLALIPVIWVIQTQVIAREEPYLAGKFGIAYHDYSRRVRRWL